MRKEVWRMSDSPMTVQEMGRKGGLARMHTMTPEQRKAISQKALAAKRAKADARRNQTPEAAGEGCK